MTDKRSVVNSGTVPLADNGFPELPARYPTLDVTFDVLGTMDQLTPLHSRKLPPSQPFTTFGHYL